MPVTSVPLSISADGNIRVDFVKTIAVVTAPKAATEILATTSLQLTCYLTAQLAPDASQSTFTDDRMCLTQPLERLGTTTRSLSDLEYIFDQQNAASNGNKAYMTLTPGTTGFLVVRYGIDVATAPAAGQFADVWPVECGVQVKLPGERNSTLRVKQKLGVTGPVVPDVAIAA